MRRGLVLGKFMPLHRGHVGLINFASERCDDLIVLVCAADGEPIDGETRLGWIVEEFKSNSQIKPQLLRYNEHLLPNTSESTTEVSKLWADHLKQYLPPVDVIFTSEPYGEYMAQHLGCRFKNFDVDRIKNPVSATNIRNEPFKYWDFIPDVVKPFYIKKVCLCGTESTGKTTLTKRLADYYKTMQVTEMAREILENTIECTEDHLIEIAELHARTINANIKQAIKLLFVDTDVNITRSYSRFLFDKDLAIPEWIDEVNQFDLYLYLDNDAPYIQDGTRLEKIERDKLDQSHKQQLAIRGINYVLINGNWDERFEKAVKYVDALLQ